MIDFFPFKLGKQMPARELRQCKHFSSPSINAVYITPFQSPGDIGKASPNAFAINIRYLHNSIRASAWLWMRLLCFSSPSPFFNLLSSLSFFLLNIKDLLNDSPLSGSILQNRRANKKWVVRILLQLLVSVISLGDILEIWKCKDVQSHFAVPALFPRSYIGMREMCANVSTCPTLPDTAAPNNARCSAVDWASIDIWNLFDIVIWNLLPVFITTAYSQKKYYYGTYIDQGKPQLASFSILFLEFNHLHQRG